MGRLPPSTGLEPAVSASFEQPYPLPPTVSPMKTADHCGSHPYRALPCIRTSTNIGPPSYLRASPLGHDGYFFLEFWPTPLPDLDPICPLRTTDRRGRIDTLWPLTSSSIGSGIGTLGTPNVPLREPPPRGAVFACRAGFSSAGSPAGSRNTGITSSGAITTTWATSASASAFLWLG